MAKKLPPIPAKRYFRIGEASTLCGVKDYVLRYWEKEFSQIRPKKIVGHRYYQARDIEMLRQIRDLLHVKGLTVAGAKKYLEAQASQPAEVPETKVITQQPQLSVVVDDVLIRTAISELEEIKDFLRN